MKVLQSVLLIVSVFSANLLYAQTADEIVAKHIEALGGKEKLGQINSVYTETSTEVMGNEGAGKTYLLNGKGFKSESEFGGQKVVQCFTDKGGWIVSPFGGDAAPQKMPSEQYNYGKNQIFAAGGLYDYASKGNKIELIGKDKKDFKIKLTTADNSELVYYIDGTTYYISKMVSKTSMMGQQATVTVSYSDYKKTDFGNVMPFAYQIDLGQYSLGNTVKKVEINKQIDAAIFDEGK